MEIRKLILAVALASVAPLAVANSSHGDNGGCQGNCAGNGGSGPVTSTGIGVGYGQGGAGGVGYGGAGGQGGQGGAGGMGGVGTGGSVAGSGNSHNTNTNLNANSNTNRNTNKQGQAQGQRQGQLQGQQQRASAKQGQSQSSRNDNRSSARNTNSNANSGNNASQGQTVNVGGDTYEAARIPVATAYAAPLVAGTNTCMGSTTAGAQGMTIGVSVGTTWEDHGCTMRSNAATLFTLGEQKAAVALLCQDKSIAKAMATAGTPCPGEPKPNKAVALASTHKATPAEVKAGYTGTDPIVRRRLGLPPLK